MSRDVTDPRVVEILAAFYRFAGSHARADNPEILSRHVTQVLGFHVEEEVFDDWPDSGLLAVLTAYLQHAPEEDLDATVPLARLEVQWLFHFEHTDAIERATGKRYDSSFDYQRALAGKVQ